MNIVRALAVGLAGFVMATSLADAKTYSSAGVTVEEFQAFMTSQGLPATIKPNEGGRVERDGDQIISTEWSGIYYDVYFYDCGGGRCRTAQFAVGWDPCTVGGSLNTWNKSIRWIRAYVGAQNVCWGEMDFVVSDTTPESLAFSLNRWYAALREFKSFISTGALTSSNEFRQDGRFAAAGLISGRTTFAEAVARLGTPATDVRLSDGTRSLGYPNEQVRQRLGAKLSDPRALTTLSFNQSGVLTAVNVAGESRPARNRGH